MPGGTPSLEKACRGDTHSGLAVVEKPIDITELRRVLASIDPK
jgi:hypothetical protein